MSGLNNILDGGARGWVVAEGTQGMPERSKGGKKRKDCDPDGWSDWDLKVNRMLGRTTAQMNVARAQSRAFVDALRERVRAQLDAQGIGTSDTSDIPF